MSNIFEFAVANKLRFPYKGQITTEDLYDLTTTQLDSIYKTLKRESKENENEDSLLVKQTSEDITLNVKIDIVKHIVAEKLKRIEDAKKSKEIKEKKQRLLEIKARREDEALENMSDEELNKALAELDAN